MGGIAILLEKSIGAAPISEIQSDRICGIRFPLDDGVSSTLSVFGVYLPCLNMGVDCSKEYLLELERVTSAAALVGPVAILGILMLILAGVGVKEGLER